MVVTISKLAVSWALGLLALTSILVAPSSAGPTTTLTVPVDGACCLPDGGCLDLTEFGCSDEGVYQGDDTVCDIGVCPEPLDGACCLPDGGCLDLTEINCSDDGVYQGDGTVCDVGVCDPVCGDADGDGDVKAGDALIALKTAVGSAECIVARCDYDGSGTVLASDALAILKTAVGQPVTPMCPHV